MVQPGSSRIREEESAANLSLGAGTRAPRTRTHTPARSHRAARRAAADGAAAVAEFQTAEALLYADVEFLLTEAKRAKGDELEDPAQQVYARTPRSAPSSSATDAAGRWHARGRNQAAGAYAGVRGEDEPVQEQGHRRRREKVRALRRRPPPPPAAVLSLARASAQAHAHTRTHTSARTQAHGRTLGHPRLWTAVGC